MLHEPVTEEAVDRGRHGAEEVLHEPERPAGRAREPRWLVRDARLGHALSLGSCTAGLRPPRLVGLPPLPRPSPPPRHAPARVFASPRGQRRYRRATDVFVLVPSLLGLALLIAVYPPSAFERSLVRL